MTTLNDAQTLLDSLCDRVGLTHRKLELVPKLGHTAGVHAFNQSLILIGQPLLDALDEEQLGAVFAHELGHILFGDNKKRLRYTAASLLILTTLGVLIFPLPPITIAIIALLSTSFTLRRMTRHQEYVADFFAAVITSKKALVRALRRLEQLNKNTGPEWLSTHPTLVHRLEAMDAAPWPDGLIP